MSGCQTNKIRDLLKTPKVAQDLAKEGQRENISMKYFSDCKQIVIIIKHHQQYHRHCHHDPHYLTDTAKQTAPGVQRFFLNVNVSHSTSHQTLYLYLYHHYHA